MKRLYINHKSGWDELVKKEFLDAKELFVKEIKNATALPLRVYYDKWDTFYEGGIVDENFNFLGGVERGKKGSKYSISCTRSYVLGEQTRERERESR